jgi:hypothetical protein
MSGLSPSPRRRAAVLGAAAAFTATVVVAGSQPSASGADTMRFRFEEVSFRYVDLPPLGEGEDSLPSAGDYFVLKNKLLRGDERVGSLHATCVFPTRAKDPARIRLLCTGAYSLPGGTLVGTAVLGGTEEVNHIAITGGTGRFAGMSGTAIEHNNEDGSGRVVIRVS